MITERYRSPSYRPGLVHRRYVRRVGDVMIMGKDGRPRFEAMQSRRYRVFECARMSDNSNRTKALARIGAGPTIREYDCTVTDLPLPLVNLIGASSDMVEWKDGR